MIWWRKAPPRGFIIILVIGWSNKIMGSIAETICRVLLTNEEPQARFTLCEKYWTKRTKELFEHLLQLRDPKLCENLEECAVNQSESTPHKSWLEVQFAQDQVILTPYWSAVIVATIRKWHNMAQSGLILATDHFSVICLFLGKIWYCA